MKNIGLIIILELLILFCPFVFAATINVPSDYSTIQSAIGNASNRDTILIGNGTFNEDLTLGKKLTIIGSGTTDTTILNGAHIISSDDVTLSDIIFISGAGETTITIDTSSSIIDNIEISDSIFNITSSPTVGIYIGGEVNKVRDVKIKNNIFNGPSDMICNPWKIGGSFTSPISAEVDGLEFEHNTINYCSIPINLDDENLKNILVNNNTFRSTDGALYIWGEGSPSGKLSNFVFTNNDLDSTNSYGIGIFGFDGDLTDDVFTDSNFGIGNKINYNRFIGISGAYGLNATSILATLTSYELDATINNWGNCDGPSGAGPGTGSAVSSNVIFEPWLGLCIENKTGGECAIESSNIILKANVTGVKIETVKFSYTINGTNKNKTASLINSLYQIIISPSELVGAQNITWNVYAQDSFGNIFKNGLKSFYVRSKSSVSVSPSTADGLNNWYVTEPLFSLSSDDNVNDIFYQWDSVPNGPFLYTSPFGLENIPNAPPIESAGTLELKWWADFGCRNETIQEKVFFVDLFSPIITDLNPGNNSIVYNLRPEISAYLEEFYQSNSGIDESSIVFKLDNVVVTPNITEVDLDALVSYIPPSDLSQSIHTATIIVTDNSGRTTQVSWPFNTTLTPALTMQVHSPINTIYTSRRILFNISLDGEVEELEYIDNLDNNPRFRRLCRNCDSYNRFKSFRDGKHNITIRAIDEFSNTKEENISFFIDSKSPRISRTLPKRRVVTNGSEEFYVKFTEDNPTNLMLVSNKTDYFPVNLTICNTSRSFTECNFKLNLSSYDGEKIEYYFYLIDIANSSATSRPTEIIVDTKAPKINNNITEDLEIDRRVNFFVNITEENFDEATYSYIDYRGRDRVRRLCSRLDNGICEKKISFRDGTYNVTINVFDKAGNRASQEVLFEV